MKPSMYSIGAGIALVVAMFTATSMVLSPKSVTLSAKDWTCVGTTSIGIEAKCIEFRYAH